MWAHVLQRAPSRRLVRGLSHVYSHKMPTVYMKEPNPALDKGILRRFHSTPTCFQLTKNPPQGRNHRVIDVELDELDSIQPCAKCYPDYPRAKVSVRYCWECKSSRPCRHNGGVRVPVQSRMGRRSWTCEPDDLQTKFLTMWPAQAKKYTES